VLVFRRGGVRFAVSLKDVRRVAARSAVHSLPLAAKDILGVLPDGNHIVPLMASVLPPLAAECVRPRILLLENGDAPLALQVEHIEGPTQARVTPIQQMGLEDQDVWASRWPKGVVCGTVALKLRGPDGRLEASVLPLLDPQALYRCRGIEEAP